MGRDPYAKFARDYDARWGRFSERTHARVLARLPADLSGQRLLDVGCGTGTLIATILAGHPTVGVITGVDVSASMLARARQKLAAGIGAGRVALVQQRGALPAFPPGVFDVVVCANTFHYFPEPAATLRALRGALQPDGRLILEDYAKRGPLARYFEWAIGRYDPLHRRAYDLAEVERLLAAAGFAPRDGAEFRVDAWWRGWVVTGTRTP